MADRISFSGQHLALPEIFAQHADVEASLRSYFSPASVSDKVIGDLKGAFKYRHWLAHGRYWEPKLGQKYDYYSVYILAESIFGSFPFEGMKRTQPVMYANSPASM
jgi:hypothetical protein